MTNRALLAAAAGAALLVAGSAAPAAAAGLQPWQMTFQEPATRVMEYIDWFNDFTLIIITLIVIFVMGLMGWCVVRYSHKANPKAQSFSHNTMIEVIWTVAPIFILLIIAVPSFRLLYAQYDPSKLYDEFDPATSRFLTVKATGYQWYWGYEYGADEDNGTFGVAQEVSFDSLMLQDDERGPDDPRLLAVDNEMVVPVNTFVRMQVIGADVIHSFAMPSFGVKVDAVPGRLNETYFRAEREGIYYGQCSELCGKDHAFMPIAIRVVSADQFGKWAAAAADDVEAANQMLAGLIAGPNDTTKVAAR